MANREKGTDLYSFESIKSMFGTQKEKFLKRNYTHLKKQLAGATFFQPEENDAIAFSGFLRRRFW